MLRLLLVTAFLADIVLVASSTAVAEATASYDGSSTAATATSGTESTPSTAGCCGPNEEYDACPDLCAVQECSQVGFPIFCPASTDNGTCLSKPACVCKTDYAKNDKGKCIPIIDCPSCGGDGNATSGCGIYCGNRCSNYDKGPVACPAICLSNGCDCKKGFVYDDNRKICIYSEDCTQICGQNEEYSNCVEGGCVTSPRNCSQLEPGQNVTTICIDPIKCTPGCVCQDNFFKNSSGACVSRDECELNASCGGDPNATSGCSNYCGNRCSDYDKGPIACPLFCLVNGCACKKGFVHDDNRKICVYPEDCTQICGQNEEYSNCVEGGCVTSPRNCSQLEPGQNVTTICIDPIKCTPGCVCQDNFFKNSSGACVTRDECELNECGGPNEEYDTCPDLCSVQECSQLGFPIFCPASTANGTCLSKPACVCKTDYARNDEGICFPKIDCPSCGGDGNATSGCGIYCGNRCSNYDKGPVVCADVCLSNACDCKKGYVYDDNLKICIHPEECTQICGQNEEYTDCVEGGCVTFPRNCSQLEPGQNVTTICIKPIKCTPGCLCKDNFFKNSSGACVSRDECELNAQICGQNEEYTDCVEGGCVTFPRNCSQLEPGQNVTTICIKPIKCTPGCLCKDNFFKKSSGACVSRDECELNAQICGQNEEYSNCVEGGCVTFPRNCSQLEIGQNVTTICIDPIKCTPGCICKDNFFKSSSGACVSRDECELNEPCNGANEIYDPCPNTCDPNSCESIGKTYNCPLQPVGKKTCKGACICNPGFYRNKVRECISKENCQKCTGPFEYYSCGGACDNVCSTLSQQNQTSCPIINVKCNEMCYCQKGYARNRQNICVPISSCRGCKGEHEYHDDCIPNCPPNDSCDTYGKVYSCPAMIYNNTSDCKAACRCENNFLRSANGTCMPEEQCPCNKDPNAKPGCGCSRTCSDLIANKPPKCTKICKINACDCKVGYVLNEKTGKCIKPKDCPACPKGQILGCGNNCNRKCFNYRNGTRPYACPRLACGFNLSCQCDPSQGYWYDDSKEECVPACECPL